MQDSRQKQRQLAPPLKRPAFFKAWNKMLLLSVAGLTILGGCASTKRLEVDEARFPVPLMTPSAINLGIHLDDQLTSYVYSQNIEKQGTWEVVLGPVQRTLFTNLSKGMFDEYELVSSNVAEHLDGVLKPTIKEVQFSLPSQTRSDYYEVWIRYDFELFDKRGGLISQWSLPAYGKANKNNFGSKSVGLQEAALAACRDAMAFFSINFTKEPDVYRWISAGMPLAPTATGTQTDSQSNDAKDSAAPTAQESAAQSSSPVEFETVESETDESETAESENGSVVAVSLVAKSSFVTSSATTNLPTTALATTNLKANSKKSGTYPDQYWDYTCPATST